MRLLLVGAFPYPHHQGSQIYFREQARALLDAGADVELLTYASGLRMGDGDSALDGVAHHAPPAWTAPRGMGSGPAWGKPLADIALAMTLRQTIASKSSPGAYDAILTHNVEATLSALLGRLGLDEQPIPIVYCAHTLLGQELPTYFKRLKKKEFLASPSPGSGSWGQRSLAWLGHRIDRLLARRVDGWISMTHSAQRVMRQSSTTPGERITPPIPDPRRNPARPDPIETAERYGLEPGGYFLYSGNLDGYQEIEILGAAATLLVEAIPDPIRRPTVVVASHDAAGKHRIDKMPGLEFRHVEGGDEMQALLEAARASLLMRRAEGGYPIKLANAHAAGTPSITFHAREWGLHDGEDAMVASSDRPAATLAGSILKLSGDADLAARLGAGARRLYETHHRPERVAEQTLALVRKVLEARNSDATTPDPTRSAQSAR
jgi:glycosyltransferase involved in cell wall biosynthesis